MEKKAPEGSRAALRRAKKSVYKCKICERKFGSCQGLAGHMNGHRFDYAYKKGSSQQSVQNELQPLLNVQSPFPVTFRPPTNEPRFRHIGAHIGPTVFTHGPASVMQPRFGGLGHASLTNIPPSVRIWTTQLENQNHWAFQGFESSSERRVTYINARVVANGGEEEDVTSRAGDEVDTELKLGR